MSERLSSLGYWSRALILGTLLGILLFAVYLGMAVIG